MDQQNKDQQNKDQQNKDQQNKDQQNKDQQNKDQQNKDQQNMPSPSRAKKKEPGKLTKAQILDLLKSESQNEKPFQMQRFLLPEFKRKDRNVDKDW